MIVRVCIFKLGHKGKDTGNRQTSHTCAPTPKTKSKAHTPPMSTDPNVPLFEISNGDDMTYEDDPAIIQARANLTAAEHVQQEKAEQKRLEREEQRVWAEVEKLKGEVEEAEKRRRELEEAEMRRLAQEKDCLEKEVEEQRGV